MTSALIPSNFSSDTKDVWMQKNCHQYLYLISTTTKDNLAHRIQTQALSWCLEELITYLLIVRDIIRMWGVFRVCRYFVFSAVGVVFCLQVKLWLMFATDAKYSCAWGLSFSKTIKKIQNFQDPFSIPICRNKSRVRVSMASYEPGCFTFMYVPHTVLYKFPKELTRRICLIIKSCLERDHFLHSRDLKVWFRADIVRRNTTLVALCVWLTKQ